MAKNDKTLFFCGECGHESAKWLGRCPACNAWNTMVEAPVLKGGRASAIAKISSIPLPLSAIDTRQLTRSSTGMDELDRVLGGGLAAGMVVLLGGDPGIGKSTLLLQVAGFAAKGAKVLYVTGEESAAQVKHRADRLSIESDMLLLAETDFSAIEDAILKTNPALVVVDSIQTMYVSALPGTAGSVSQVREATALLTQLAKRTGSAIWIVGHVTKDGAMAGPRVLEHMVDVVLYFEGERHADLRLLRAVKNRFGSTNEIGVFEMRDTGMRPVEDPSRLFLSGLHLPGCAVICTIEGTRPLLAEVQALLAQTAFGSPRRTAAGVDTARLSLLLAVLENKARLKLSDKDVYLNVVGGLKLMDRGADLGLALCIASCQKETPLPSSTAVIGEIGLTGEVRTVSHMEKRMCECIRLGFNHLIIPRSEGLPRVEGAKITLVRNIAEAVALI